jgi:hypothetical protein
MKLTLRTKVHGYTSWANMRVSAYDHSMNNVLMDILTGTNMKYLIQSYTGQKNDKFNTFDGYDWIKILINIISSFIQFIVKINSRTISYSCKMGFKR